MILAFEGLRGLAALLVALFHIGNLSGFLPLRHLYLCVDLFFVVSGWVIASNYWNRIQDWPQFRLFVVRRSGRLLPLLFFSTLAYIVMVNLMVLAKHASVVLGAPIRAEARAPLAMILPKLPELLGVFTLTHGMGLFHRLFLNAPSWSISTEFYTYLLFGLCCIHLGDRARTAACALLLLAGAATTIIGTVWFRHPRVFTGFMDVSFDLGFPRCVWSFFMGALAFRLGPRLTLPKVWIQAFALGGIGILLGFIERIPALAFLFPVLFTLLVFAISTDQGPVARFCRTRWMQVLGQRSYSIYLMHVPLNLLFIPVTNRLEGRGPGFALAEDAAFAVILVLISGLTFRYIEDPCRTRVKAWSGRRRAPALPLLGVPGTGNVGGVGNPQPD